MSLLQLAIPDEITNLSLAHISGAGHIYLWLKRLIRPMAENLKDILNITDEVTLWRYRLPYITHRSTSDRM
jgi:hypothetical protein